MELGKVNVETPKHHNNQAQPIKKLIPLIMKHSELIAALFSGLLILIGWLLFENYQSTSVILYLSAFAIGGFAKAKEGIEDTIANKELNVEILMILAAIGSAIIGYWAEGAILIFIFALSGALETYTLNKSHKEIESLMDLQPNEALVIDGNHEIVVPVSQLNLGDIVKIKPGERIPTDGKILTGKTTIDESAITGESIPVSKENDGVIYTGTVNLTGSITAEVTKRSDETLFQKIVHLVQEAQNEKSPSQQFIEKFEGYYVKAVLAFVGLMLFLPHYALGWGWEETIYRAMVLLVVASPCALVASIMPATLSAISNGARKGILFKGGSHIEQLGLLEAIAFDKTGTLTNGKPVVTDMKQRIGMDENELITITASIENHSNHPLAQAIVTYAKSRDITTFMSVDEMKDVSGWGVKAILNGKEWTIGKKGFVGEEEANSFANGISKELEEEGKTIVYVSDENGIAGIFALKDTIRQNCNAAVKQLNDAGLYTMMITGDSQKTAEAISSEAGVKNFIAECLPEEKVNHIKTLNKQYRHVAMVGDGINDAPALATANVGIAMGEGTDVALETSDVVLMKNDLSRIADAIKLSKKMNRIIKQNIFFSITVIVMLIISNFLQFLDLPFAVIGHEGSTILVILNSLRLLR
ncbi:heavy metal translocating P-type ATPase [Lottiidibacillus patelloidae]|uniref:Heavy metal translocating P-type ATPase n=1 Tax=Lottiidibacillus patelloidae TaxID=2670334 RepID=A0A263BTI2_9BACI|nr:heavy metal translocating P-type ATPase [Lottiidibacillus patelloidae]